MHEDYDNISLENLIRMVFYINKEVIVQPLINRIVVSSADKPIFGWGENLREALIDYMSQVEIQDGAKDGDNGI